MDQSTENLLTSPFHQSNGYINESLNNSSEPSSLEFIPTTSSTPEPLMTSLPFALGPYQQRRRLLSCIVENWPESDSYNSLPMEINKNNNSDFTEPKFMCRDSNGVLVEKPLSWEAEDVSDYITTLDESCILDIESYEDITQIFKATNGNGTTAIKTLPEQNQTFSSAKELYTQSLNRRPKSLHEPLANQNPVKFGIPIEKYPKIMTACYGALNTIENKNTIEGAIIPSTQYLSTENLIHAQSKGISEEFLILNPAFKQSKCRTPFPGVSLNNSFYDEMTSAHSSTNALQHLNGELGMNRNDSFNINPLEVSMVEGGGSALGSDIRLFDPEMIANVQTAAENGE